MSNRKGTSPVGNINPYVTTMTSVTTDEGEVHHHHHHYHYNVDDLESIGAVNGGFDSYPEPSSDFSLVNGFKVIAGWLACLFSYIIAGILIWIIVLLSTKE